ncbi:MAG: PAS domain S-box protein [Halobacteriales archaeon]
MPHVESITIDILHVDDESDFRELTAEYLEREDERFNVETAVSAREGMERLTDGEYDCIVSDYDMSEQDGIEFLRTVRERFPDLPFILFTGKGSEAVASDAISAGVTDYLQKEPGSEQFAILANRIANVVEQYRAQSALERSEKRYRRLVERAPVPIILFSQSGELIEANTATAEFLNAESPSALLGKDVFDFMHPDMHEEISARLRRLQADDQGQAVSPSQQKVVAVDGEIKHAIVASTPVEYAGEPAIQTIAYDITERVEQEEQLKRERDRFESLFATLPEPTVLLSGQQRSEATVSRVNRAFEEVFGYDEDEIRDENINEYIVPDERLDEAREIDRMNREGELSPKEVRRQTADGDLRDCLLLTTNLTEPGNEGMDEGFAIYADITEQKQAQRRLARERERFRTLFETLPEPMALVSGIDGPIIRDVNPAFEDVFGYESASVQGENLNDLIVPPEQREEARQLDDDAIEGDVLKKEVRRQTADGSYRDFLMLATGEFKTGPEGTSAGFVVYTDITERKQREQQLEREKQRFEAIFEHSNDAIFILDPVNDAIVDANPRAEELLGYSREELLSSVTVSDVHPEQTQQYREFLMTVEAEGSGWTDEFQCVTKTGEKRDSEISAAAVEFDDQQYLIANVRDITERKKREHRLKRERDRFQALFEELPEPIVHGHIEDGEPVVRAVNGAFEETFGYNQECLIGEPLDDFIVPPEHEDSAEELNKRVEKEHGDLANISVQRQTTTGLREFLFRYAQVPNTSNNEGFAIYTDISHQKERERRLTALHRTTRDLIQAESREQIAELAVETSHDVLDLPMSAAFLYDQADDVLRPMVQTAEVTDVIGDPPVFERGEGLVWDVFESGEPKIIADVSTEPGRYNPETPIRGEIILPLGEFGVLLIGSTEVGAFDETDTAMARILAANVEAALKRMQRNQELAQRNDQLENFTRIVSHDLRNPLNVAQGRVELAQTACDSEHLSQAADALERGLKLIDDLLTLAREGDRIDELETVTLDEAVESCWRNVTTDQATLTVRTDQRIQADRGRLKQLLENLIRNAVEHGGEDVTVEIGELQDGFYVADDGRGITDEEAEHLFDLGYSNTDDGTGFGLNIVKRIAESHDWNITVTESETGGTRFEFTGVERPD